MEQIRELVGGVCMLSLAVGLCSLMGIGKALERQIRFILSLLFLLALILPFKELDIRELGDLSLFAEQEVHAGELTEELNRQMAEETRKQICSSVGQLLTDAGFSWEKVDASVHIDETGCIYISEVHVLCRDARGAEELLQPIFGEEAKIYVEEPAA